MCGITTFLSLYYILTTANLDTLTRASIMMTPPSVRRVPGAGCGVGMYAPSSSGEDVCIH